MVEDREQKDILKIHETGLFFKFLPDKILCFKVKIFNGGNKSKEILTVLIVTNMYGSEKLPLYFKNINSLSVYYEFLKVSFLNSIKVLLFTDNCTELNKIPKLSSIKIIFFPANITSQKQPIDQDIIQILNIFISYKSRKVYVIAFQIIVIISYKKTVKICFQKTGFPLLPLSTSHYEMEEQETDTF